MEKKKKNEENTEINEENSETYKKIENLEKDERKLVVPGELLETGTEFLPGEGTKRDGKDIIATKFGLLDKNEKILRVIPLSGSYIPRFGNVVIGLVYDITFNGWLVDIASPFNAFLPVAECSKFVNKNDLLDTFGFHEVIVTKIKDIKSRGVDLTMRERGLRKLEGGMLIKINSAKVPRIIGKGGSMVNMLKQETGTNIVVGQNGIIWVGSDNVEKELLAKKAIEFITEKPFIHGLTELVQSFLDEEKKRMKIEIKPIPQTMEDY